MIEFLVMQIRLGKITIEQVPARYYEAVKSILLKKRRRLRVTDIKTEVGYKPCAGNRLLDLIYLSDIGYYHILRLKSCRICKQRADFIPFAVKYHGRHCKSVNTVRFFNKL